MSKGYRLTPEILKESYWKAAKTRPLCERYTISQVMNILTEELPSFSRFNSKILEKLKLITPTSTTRRIKANGQKTKEMKLYSFPQFCPGDETFEKLYRVMRGETLEEEEEVTGLTKDEYIDTLLSNISVLEENNTELAEKVSALEKELTSAYETNKFYEQRIQSLELDATMTVSDYEKLRNLEEKGPEGLFVEHLKKLGVKEISIKL